MFNSPIVNWIIAGLALSLLELIVPGVYLIWFGLAAFVVGIAIYFIPMVFTTQLIIFAIASGIFAVIGVVVYRNIFNRVKVPSEYRNLNNTAEQFVGQLVTISEDAADNRTKVKIGDTYWLASCQKPFKKGDTAKVVGVKDSLILIIGKNMLHIGCHLSISKGFEHIGKEALSIKADTFQFFTRNPQGGKAKEIDAVDAAKLRQLTKEHSFAPIVAHAPYTLNPCSNNQQTREFAEMVFADDLKRMEYIPHNYYNFHPGSHVGQGVSVGISMIIDLLNRILTPEQNTIVLLETMSGKGSEIGSSFEELAEICSGVKLKNKLGICLDTCHVFAAGYDLVNDLDGVLSHFDKTLGLENLKAVHLNDSLMPLKSNKDRHAQIGKGLIGEKALVNFINHRELKKLPFILETPNDLAGYAEEINFLRNNFQ